MLKRIHITGASGTGTTTLAAGLADQWGVTHLDTDDFFWKKTAPPFTERHSAASRLEAMESAILGKDEWILSGSLCGWGDPIIQHFTHFVFLSVPWLVRMERLIERESRRYGATALAAGGAMHQVHIDFMKWTSRYDTAGTEQLSRLTHERWLANLPKAIQVIRLDGEGDVKSLLKSISSGMGP